MASIGYVPSPSSSAPGVGAILPDQERQTVLGAFTSATWLTSIETRVGRNTGTNATLRAAIRHVTSAGKPGELISATEPKTVTTYWDDSGPTGGVNTTWSVFGVGCAAGQRVAAGLHPTGSSIAYSQDNSGARLYRDTSAGTVPAATFDVDAESPEGRISIRLTGQSNRNPNQPVVTNPVRNGMTADTTPGITVTFSDPDDVHGDTFGAYLIEVWDQANTTRLQTSGKTATTAAERDAAEATWAVPSALTPGTYTLRVRTYDAFGAVSPVREQAFTVNAGGVFSGMETNPADIAGTTPEGAGITNSARPGVRATWTHDTGAATVSGEVRIRTLVNILEEALGGAVEEVRPATATAMTVAANGVASLAYPAGWADLPRGEEVYVWQMRATDALGGVSPWATSAPFIVNAWPVTTATDPLDGESVAQLPALLATVTDANDDAGSHIVSCDIRPVGGNAVTIWPSHLGGGVYRALPSTTEMPTLGSYEWRMYSTDPWGLYDYSPWQLLHYVEAPAITGISPAGTITTGTPTITATVDRTLTKRRVTVRAAGSTRVYSDTGEQDVSGTTISVPIPEATLPNATDYEHDIWVRTADGLETSVTTAFRVEYAAPWYLSGVTATTERSSEFDRAPFEQFPNVRLAWDAPDLATVTDEDWVGYVIYRTGGERDRQWTITDRTQATFVDTTAPGATPLIYYVGYLSRINAGLDIIESMLAAMSVTVDLRHTTITSDNPDDPAVTLHYWADRARRTEPRREYVTIMGLADPVAFQGPQRRRDIDIDITALSDQSGQAWYTAADIVAALEALAESITNADGADVPRSLFWRDPTGRAFPLGIDDIDVQDGHRTDRARVRLRGTQVSRGAALPVSVNEDQSRDMTGVVEPQLLIDFEGDLDGETRSGPTTATAAGPVTYIASAAGQAAVVAAGTTITLPVTTVPSVTAIRYSDDSGATWNVAHLTGSGAFGAVGTVTRTSTGIDITVTNGDVAIDAIRVDSRDLTLDEQTRLDADDTWTWTGLYVGGYEPPTEPVYDTFVWA